MDNKTKQHLSALEFRVKVLENMMESAANSFYADVNQPRNCTQCGMSIYNEYYVCGQIDCCQGLNPTDDMESVQYTGNKE